MLSQDPSAGSMPGSRTCSPAAAVAVSGATKPKSLLAVVGWGMPWDQMVAVPTLLLVSVQAWDPGGPSTVGGGCRPHG